MWDSNSHMNEEPLLLLHYITAVTSRWNKSKKWYSVVETGQLSNKCLMCMNNIYTCAFIVKTPNRMFYFGDLTAARLDGGWQSSSSYQLLAWLILRRPLTVSSRSVAFLRLNAHGLTLSSLRSPTDNFRSEKQAALWLSPVSMAAVQVGELAEHPGRHEFALACR